VALTPASQELQKLIAFENAFDKIFAIIELDGSLCHGGITVQDCLALLANLLRLNTSNQSFFRETGGVLKVADLLRKYIADATTRQDLPEWTTDQKDKNIWGTMSVIRLFLTGGSVGTQMNQNAFWQSHVTFYVLDLAFSEAIPTAVRSEVRKSQSVVLSKFQSRLGILHLRRFNQVQWHPPGAIWAARSTCLHSHY
jgi:hypothetical protein